MQKQIEIKWYNNTIQEDKKMKNQTPRTTGCAGTTVRGGGRPHRANPFVPPTGGGGGI